MGAEVIVHPAAKGGDVADVDGRHVVRTDAGRGDDVDALRLLRAAALGHPARDETQPVFVDDRLDVVERVGRRRRNLRRGRERYEADDRRRGRGADLRAENEQFFAAVVQDDGLLRRLLDLHFRVGQHHPPHVGERGRAEASEDRKAEQECRFVHRQSRAGCESVAANAASQDGRQAETQPLLPRGVIFADNIGRELAGEYRPGPAYRNGKAGLRRSVQ